MSYHYLLALLVPLISYCSFFWGCLYQQEVAVTFQFGILVHMAPTDVSPLACLTPFATVQSTRFSTQVFLLRFCQFFLALFYCLLLMCFCLFLLGFSCFCYFLLFFLRYLASRLQLPGHGGSTIAYFRSMRLFRTFPPNILTGLFGHFKGL